MGSISGGAPYLAGLAALGLHVNPQPRPARLRSYLLKTVWKMPYGNVVNPAAYVTMCREDPDAKM